MARSHVWWNRALIIGAVVALVSGAAFAVSSGGVRSKSGTVSRRSTGRSRHFQRRVEVHAARAARPGAAVRSENARAGTDGWQISNGDDKPRPIEGFADHVSAQRGDRIRLYVTTRAPSFRVEAYRTGWYHGIGARLIWESAPAAGRAQPPCAVLAPTRTVDCFDWAPSLSLRIGQQWVPGQYLLKLVQPDGGASFVPLVIRDDHSHAAIVVIASVTTIEAYNGWGGYSLYGDSTGRSRNRATIVSFDRPFGGWANSGFVLGDTYELAQMAESQGMDVTYATDLDVHRHPELLDNHHVVISGAHDEYYSLEMRNGLQAARDHGVNIIFLGANAVYRRIRLEPSALGADRLEVNYRSAALDPLTRSDPSRVTTNWGDPPAAQRPSTLTGTTYECSQAGLSADMVVVDASAWMFQGTGVTDGEHLPGMVRDEYDRLIPSRDTPPGAEVLTHSPLTCRGRQSWSDMAYYGAPSGAGVVDVGTLMFEPHLGPLCAPADLTAVHWECQLRQTVNNIVTEFARGPAATRRPPHSNVERLGILRLPTSSIANE
jgi:hypothetical protein